MVLVRASPGMTDDRGLMMALLQEWAADRGYRVACGDIRVLDEVKSELQQRRTAGELDASFDRKRLDFFRYEESSEAIPHPRAVIVVAVPRPAHRLVFELETGAFETILPPTYVNYSEIYQQVQEDIVSQIAELRGHLELLLAPLKAVACRLGLVFYGRNNITYIPEFGSYFQLVGYVTDADLHIPEDWSPKPLRLMPECDTCGICVSVCPTSAINDDRVLLHAERCTTFFSEEPGDLLYDIGYLSGPCLFGCLECQQVCPINTGLLRILPSSVAFDRPEAEAILAGNVDEKHELSLSINRKLAILGLTEQALIGRNLGNLVAHRNVLAG